MIALNFAAPDGRWRRTYKTLEGARAEAKRLLGATPELSSNFGYAVSPDGIVTMRPEGASFDELFPDMAGAWAFEREEAARIAEEDALMREAMDNYQECEHGMDASLCGGPMHWYDNDYDARPF